MCKCDYLCGIIITKGTLNASLLQDRGGEECHLLVLMLLFLGTFMFYMEQKHGYRCSVYANGNIG